MLSLATGVTSCPKHYKHWRHYSDYSLKQSRKVTLECLTWVSFSPDQEKISLINFIFLLLFRPRHQPHWSVLEFCNLSNGQVFFLGCGSWNQKQYFGNDLVMMNRNKLLQTRSQRQIEGLTYPFLWLKESLVNMSQMNWQYCRLINSSRMNVMRKERGMLSPFEWLYIGASFHIWLAQGTKSALCSSCAIINVKPILWIFGMIPAF